MKMIYVKRFVEDKNGKKKLAQRGFWVKESNKYFNFYRKSNAYKVVKERDAK